MPTPRTEASDEETMAQVAQQCVEKNTWPMWTVADKVSKLNPNSRASATAWRWAEMRRLMLEAGSSVPEEKAERRALMMVNPGFPEKGGPSPYTTDTLYAGFQMVLPGETAPAHRHMTYAVRLILESDKGFTSVSGHKIYLEPGDLVLTPSWQWHYHGNDGTTPTFWVDCLDIPLHVFARINFLELYPTPRVPDLVTEGSLFHLPCKVAKQSLDTPDGPRAVYNYLRRRLWWQLLTLVDHPDDFGVEGIAPSVCTDEKLPLNVNNCELEFAAAAAGEEHDGFTESSFCLMQYEITKTFNRIRSERSLTPAERNLVADRAEHRLHATRDAMEAKYFRYSSGESPISRFAAHIIAMILAKRRLLLHISPPYNQHSHSLLPRTCDLLFLLGIHVQELSRTVQKARCFERWRWLGASYFQWSAATFVASELAARPKSPATRRAWHVVNGLLDDWPEATRCLAKAAALKALITNAIRNRDAGNIWNMGIPSELDDQNQYGLPSETAQGNASAGKKKGESQTDHDQQQLDLSTLGQEFDLEDFVLSEMSFDQNAFSTDFTFT